MFSPETRRKANGTALIEVMLGITIGLMVVAAALGVTGTTLSASAASRDAADLQERADSALRHIALQVRQAGAVQLQPWGATGQFSAMFKGWNDAGPAIAGIEGGPGKADTLRVSFEPAAGEHDCLGNQSGAVNHVDSEFTVGADSTASGRSALFCENAANTTGKQSLVAGVDDLQVLYGIRDMSENLRYVTADALDGTTEVLAVKVCLQLSSEAVHGAPAVPDCNGKPIPASKSAGRMVRIARGVFMVRNAAG